MGCMQIMPLMYFQLNNVPMWRGAYMISKVSHKIRPGSMSTQFTGYRVCKYRIPFADGTPTYPINIDLSNYKFTGSTGGGYLAGSTTLDGPATNMIYRKNVDTFDHSDNYIKLSPEQFVLSCITMGWTSNDTKEVAAYILGHCRNTDSNHHLCAQYTYNLARRLVEGDKYQCRIKPKYNAGGNANMAGYWNSLKELGFTPVVITPPNGNDKDLTHKEISQILGRDGYSPIFKDIWGAVVVFYAHHSDGKTKMHTQMYCGTNIIEYGCQGDTTSSVCNELTHWGKQASGGLTNGNNNSKVPWVADNCYPQSMTYQKQSKENTPGYERNWRLIGFIPPPAWEIKRQRGETY